MPLKKKTGAPSDPNIGKISLKDLMNGAIPQTPDQTPNSAKQAPSNLTKQESPITTSQSQPNLPPIQESDPPGRLSKIPDFDDGIDEFTGEQQAVDVTPPSLTPVTNSPPQGAPIQKNIFSQDKGSPIPLDEAPGHVVSNPFNPQPPRSSPLNQGNIFDVPVKESEIETAPESGFPPFVPPQQSSPLVPPQQSFPPQGVPAQLSPPPFIPPAQSSPPPLLAQTETPSQVASPLAPAPVIGSQPFQAPPQYSSVPQVNVETPVPATGFSYQDFGTDVSRFEIGRAKFLEGKVYRGAIPFIEQMGVARYHYDRKIGTFFCYGGQCCKRYRIPNVRVILPWILYSTDKRGTVIARDIQCHFLQLSEEDYSDQIKLYAISNNITNYDFQVICSNERYQTCVYTMLNECYWRSDKDLTNLIAQKFTELWPKVPQAIAKSLTEEEYQQTVKENPMENNNYPDYPQFQQTDLSRFQKR